MKIKIQRYLIKKFKLFFSRSIQGSVCLLKSSFFLESEFRESELFSDVWYIVIKPGPGVDPAKGPGPRFQGSTRVNSGQPGLTRKN